MSTRQWLKRGCDNIFVIDGEIIARISQHQHWEYDKWWHWQEKKRDFVTLKAAKDAIEAWYNLPRLDWQR